MTTRPERWIFQLNEEATDKETKAVADKIDALGKAEGFKTVDWISGLLLVECNGAFARRAEKELAGELRGVSKENFIKRPDTRLRPIKPPKP